MPGEKSKEIVGRFWTVVLGEGRLEAADELFARDHVVHHPFLSGEDRGSGVMQAFASLLRRALPDLRVTVEDEIAEGEKVVLRWRISGTLAEETPGAGSWTEVWGISIHHIADDRIKETWMHIETQQDADQRPALRPEVEEWLMEDPLVRDSSSEMAARFICLICPRCCWRVSSSTSE